jgi:hypothetical protein
MNYNHAHFNSLTFECMKPILLFCRKGFVKAFLLFFVAHYMSLAQTPETFTKNKSSSPAGPFKPGDKATIHFEHGGFTPGNFYFTSLIHVDDIEFSIGHTSSFDGTMEVEIPEDIAPGTYGLKVTGASGVPVMADYNIMRENLNFRSDQWVNLKGNESGILRFNQAGERLAELRSVDFSTGGYAQFDFKWLETSNSKGSDVVLEYSLDMGQTYRVLYVLLPEVNYQAWIRADLPQGMKSENVVFRFRQLTPQENDANAWELNMVRMVKKGNVIMPRYYENIFMVIEGNQITIDNLSQTKFCAGEEFSISYKLFREFSTNHILTAQISNRNGTFERPIDIGSIEGKNNGQIQVKLPGDLESGHRYKIRIIARNSGKIVSTSRPTREIEITAKVNGQASLASSTTQICSGSNFSVELNNTQLGVYYKISRATGSNEWVSKEVQGTGGSIAIESNKGLGEGEYKVWALAKSIDGQACEDWKDVNLTFTASQIVALYLRAKDAFDNPLPPANGKIAVCSNQQIILYLPRFEDATYTWFKNGTSLGNMDPKQHSVAINNSSSQGNGDYHAKVQIKGESECIIVTDPLRLQFDAKPNKPTLTSEGDKDVCPNLEKVKLIAQSGFTSYLWYKNGHFLEATSGNTFEVTTSGDYTVVVKNDGSCPSDQSDVQRVQFKPAPNERVVVAVKEVMCDPGNAIVKVLGSESDVVYKLIHKESGNQIGDPQKGTGGDLEFVVSVDKSASFIVDGTKEGTSCSLVIGQTSIRVFPSKAVIVSQNNKLIAPEAASYQWFRNEVEIFGAVDKELKVYQSGTYTVLLKTGDCQVVSEPFGFSINSLKDLSLENIVVVYPNPSSGMIFLKLNGQAKGKVQIRLYDTQGKVFEDFILDNSKTYQDIQMDLNKLHIGQYFLEVKYNNTVVVRKVLKQ